MCLSVGSIWEHPHRLACHNTADVFTQLFLWSLAKMPELEWVQGVPTSLKSNFQTVACTYLNSLIDEKTLNSRNFFVCSTVCTMQKMYAFVCSSVADAADLPHIFVVVNVVHEEAADLKKNKRSQVQNLILHYSLPVIYSREVVWILTVSKDFYLHWNSCKIKFAAAAWTLKDFNIASRRVVLFEELFLFISGLSSARFYDNFCV